MYVQVSICTIHFHLMWAKQIKSTSNLLSYSFSVSLPCVFPCCEFVDCLHDPTGQNDLSWMDVCLFPICSIILQSPKKNCPKVFSQYEVIQFRFQTFTTAEETGDKLGKQHKKVCSSLFTTNSQSRTKIRPFSEQGIKQIGHQPLQVCYTVNRPATYPTCQDC